MIIMVIVRTDRTTVSVRFLFSATAAADPRARSDDFKFIPLITGPEDGQKVGGNLITDVTVARRNREE